MKLIQNINTKYLFNVDGELYIHKIVSTLLHCDTIVIRPLKLFFPVAYDLGC